MPISTGVYASWRGIQYEKYEQLYPHIAKHLKKGWTVLDIGVGKGWFEDFLREKGFAFKRIVGVDSDPKMVEPRKPYIKYHLGSADDFETRDKFNLIVLFDSLHLLKEPTRILSFAKAKDAYILASEPQKFEACLNVLVEKKLVADGYIGSVEKDRFVFVKV
jgi:SAM-dependent methyltransferase